MAQTQSTDLVINDQQLLAQLGGLVNAGDTGGSQAPRLPRLKINFEPGVIDSAGRAIPEGAWVVGQTKNEDGTIGNPGERVAALIILSVRKQYNFYHHTQRQLNCNSKMFIDGDRDIIGLKHKKICMQKGACAYREKDRNPHCSQNLVVFGVAITYDKAQIDCLAYLKGMNYFPMSKYLDAVTRVKGPSGFVEIPPFAFLTRLASHMESANGKTFWVADFERGNLLNTAQIPHFVGKRDEVYAYVDRANESMIARNAAPDQNAARPAQAGPITQPMQPVTQPPVQEPQFPDMSDMIIDIPVSASKPVPPMPTMPQGGDGGDDDIPFDLGAPQTVVEQPVQPPVAQPQAPKMPSMPVENNVDFDIKAAIDSLI